VFIRLLPFIVTITIACQSGKIDSPKVRDDKIPRSKFKRFHESPATLWARHIKKKTRPPGSKEHGRYPYGKENNSIRKKEINTIAVDEWDCPRAGVGKYIPEAVKRNIRSNLAKINSEPVIGNDSLRIVSEVVLFQGTLSTEAKKRFYDRVK
jgi:hypothetical protein